jgi:hypothetical protein
MNTLKERFARKITLLLGIGAVLLSWPTLTQGGEFEPVMAGTVMGTLEIAIKNQEYTNPDLGSVSDHLLVIPEGMNVEWIDKERLTTINGDLGLMPHGIQISDESDKVLTASPILTKEHRAFSYNFSKEGTYTYRCFIHSYMKGKIVVVDMPRR